MAKSVAKSVGRYIVADPKICHGQLTFRGTRVFVRDVLDQVASGMDWDEIMEQWNHSVSREAISEAVRLASELLLKQIPKPRLRRVSMSRASR
jgi:uncharacterized protein (DUF433 family)